MEITGPVLLPHFKNRAECLVKEEVEEVRNSPKVEIQSDWLHTCWWYLLSISSWAERTRMCGRIDASFSQASSGVQQCNCHHEEDRNKQTILSQKGIPANPILLLVAILFLEATFFSFLFVVIDLIN